MEFMNLHKGTSAVLLKHPCSYREAGAQGFGGFLVLDGPSGKIVVKNVLFNSFGLSAMWYMLLISICTFSFRQLVNQSCLFNVHCFEGPTTSAKFAARVNMLGILS